MQFAQDFDLFQARTRFTVDDVARKYAASRLVVDGPVAGLEVAALAVREGREAWTSGELCDC